ncbi:MAG TPA: epimerase [Gemmatimonas aurantiaca]|uniref:NAD-dependent epimerase/dehydratase family protein n=2 Tax=Gemmatimonas aurantiaca TaxID=173480 RepID=C1A9S3_GEMAT|nr:NAD-dependent epimerase/dehydratase family protein [Gemmatimonas aurantiaca]BAH39250.1 NAD-dependent epimerase/dehydratase family protein [Gemmatimonas aurantiaca T-27]HCT57547.1 epimerase [Gemmatimonas aurantiaca]
MYNRREFLGTGLAALGAASAASLAPGLLRAAPAWAPAPKKILVLGGTGFVGPHNVREALKRGHQVTIFNRGRSGKGMFGKDVEELAGDRASDLSALKGRKWDAVIDESASLSSAPEWVKLSTEVLRDSVDQYLFISTRSVYYDLSSVPMNSNAPVLTLENSPIEAGKPLTYGHAKAYAEKAAHAAMPGRVTVVRPGLIVGPEDDTDRFTYWPVRAARGGEMLAPGDGSDHVQIIDVRDLMKFCVTLCESRTFGVFNGVGPQGGMPFKEFLARVQKGVGANPSYTWVDADFLREQGHAPYGRELPVFQVMRGRTAGFARFDLTPELKAGLTIRPMEDTARDTLAWWKTLPAERQAAPKTGFSPAREAELLAMWKARKPK